MTGVLRTGGLRVGLLGAGRIGSFHAGTLAQLAGVASLTICDPAPGRAEALAGQLGAGVAPTPAELFAARPDAVVIASATQTHAELVRTAVTAGIATFCEKPLATGLADTRDVVRLIEGSGVPVTVGFQRRSDPEYLALRAQLRGGELGEPYLIRMVVGDDAPPPAGYLPGSGGLFRDQSVHDFDLLRWLTGREVTEVYATGANLTGYPGFAEAGDVDTAVLVLRLAGGPIATLTSSRHSASGYDVRIEVAGSRQVAAVGTAGAPGGFLARFAEAYRTELHGFLALAAGTGPNPCPAPDALAALLVAEAADRSRREHRPVTPEPA
jgi:myo-inositol 2-dehydrogenase/D-chiro-inositol 1-dehydrogenase